MEPNKVDQLLPDYFHTAWQTKCFICGSNSYVSVQENHHLTKCHPCHCLWNTLYFSLSQYVTPHKTNLQGNTVSTSSFETGDAVSKDDDYLYRMTKRFRVVHFHGTQWTSERGPVCVQRGVLGPKCFECPLTARCAGVYSSFKLERRRKKRDSGGMAWPPLCPFLCVVFQT